jgi:hypothetical protein
MTLVFGEWYYFNGALTMYLQLYATATPLIKEICRK